VYLPVQLLANFVLATTALGATFGAGAISSSGLFPGLFWQAAAVKAKMQINVNLVIFSSPQINLMKAIYISKVRF
jgi:hypothetical protein